MKVYSVAERTSGPHTMGGSSDEWHICPEGAYGQGPFPPVFKERAAAERHIVETAALLGTKRRVVELELK